MTGWPSDAIFSAPWPASSFPPEGADMFAGANSPFATLTTTASTVGMDVPNVGGGGDAPAPSMDNPLPSLPSIGGGMGNAPASGSPSAGASGSGGTSCGWETYIARAVVVILGFIFVAAGLYGFSGQRIVIGNPLRAGLR